MKIEAIEGQIILKEVYNSVTLETREGKQLHICMRDMGFEMKIDDGEWHLITDESDFPIKFNEEEMERGIIMTNVKDNKKLFCDGSICLSCDIWKKNDNGCADCAKWNRKI